MRAPILIIACLALAGCAVSPERGDAGGRAAPDPAMEWRSALAAWQRGDTARALDRLERLFSAPREDASAVHEALAGSRLTAEERESTLALLEHFARRHDIATAWHVLGLMSLSAGDVETAGEASARVDALAPAWPRGIILRARVLTARGEHDEAIELLSVAVEDRPDDASSRFALAGILLASGDEPGAREQLETIIERSPGFMDAHWTLGLLQLRDGDSHGAEAHFRTLLDDPQHGHHAHHYMGVAHEMRGDWPGALEWYGRVDRGDSYVNAQVKAAHMEINLERIDAGRARFSRLREEFPGERIHLYNAEAELLGRVDLVPQALSVYDDALEADPAHAATRYSRALMRERAGDIDGAVADLRRLLDEQPGDAAVLNALGYMLADRGGERDWPEARELITRALDQEPDNPAYIDSKGWVLYRQGELEAAREWLSRAWEMTQDAEIGAHLGEVLWSLGDELAAKGVWMEAAMLQPDHPVLEDTLERLLP